jgi:hypothetical protein
MPGLHPKPEAEAPECFCGDPYKMDHDEYKEKREQEMARKREIARRAKEAYEQDGEEALRRAKWPGLP